MQKIIRSLFMLSVAFTMNGAAVAADRGTADEAIALIKSAKAFYKTNGKQKLIDEINKGSQGQFINKDLYLFIGGLKPGPNVAHGANPKLVGKDLGDLKDVDGVEFVKKFNDVANSKEGKGWVDYKWPNPTTKVVEKKSTYVERVDDMYIACGIYK